MAYHGPLPGHTQPVVGALYKRWLWESTLWRLQSYNPATGICKMIGEYPSRGGFYTSVGQLQAYHLVRRPTDRI